MREGRLGEWIGVAILSASVPALSRSQGRIVQEGGALTSKLSPRLVRAIFGDHLFSFARMLTVLVLQLSTVAMV